MKKLSIITLFLFLFASSTLMAWPVDVESQDGPQDPLFVEGPWHELGDLFPLDELIVSQFVDETQETACFDGSDNPSLFNVVVSMTNLTPYDWYDVHYVADPETSITNFDGWIGNAGLGDLEEAFKIDWVGINRPLIFESIVADAVFQVGETWEFIIQDYLHPMGPPAPFDSLGIASLSTGFPPSTGSIIAIPEPMTLVLLGLGAIALRKRKG